MNGNPVVLDGSPANIRKITEESLKRLGTDYIDLYYQRRLDSKVPIEEPSRSQSEYSDCTAVSGWTACARRIVPGPTFERLGLRDSQT